MEKTDKYGMRSWYNSHGVKWLENLVTSGCNVSFRSENNEKSVIMRVEKPVEMLFRANDDDIMSRNGLKMIREWRIDRFGPTVGDHSFSSNFARAIDHAIQTFADVVKN